MVSQVPDLYVEDTPGDKQETDMSFVCKPSV